MEMHIDTNEYRYHIFFLDLLTSGSKLYALPMRMPALHHTQGLHQGSDRI
jgi:hypothetical protein